MKQPAIPPKIYRDTEALFLEWPRVGNSPALVLRFAFTEGGVAKAMKHIPNIQSSPTRGSAIVSAHQIKAKAKVAKGTKAKREVSQFSEEESRAAGAALNKILKGDLH